MFRSTNQSASLYYCESSSGMHLLTFFQVQRTETVEKSQRLRVMRAFGATSTRLLGCALTPESPDC